MRTLHWLAIVGLVASAGLVACGSDDSGTSATGGGAGSGGTTGGTGGGADGGTGGGADGGTGGTGGATGGTGGGADGGTGGGTGGATGGTGGGTGGATGGTGGGTGGASSGWASPCVQACIADNQQGTGELIGALIPCLCVDAGGACATECADFFCADPVDMNADADCGNCALASGQDACGGSLAACTSTECGAALQCLLVCAAQ